MNEQDRAGLAESLLSNSLFQEIFDSLEESAIEVLVWADDETRLTAQLRVQAIRSFRTDCQSMIDSARLRKGVESS